jgi:hypothetical protein
LDVTAGVCHADTAFSVRLITQHRHNGSYVSNEEALMVWLLTWTVRATRAVPLCVPAQTTATHTM